MQHPVSTDTSYQTKLTILSEQVNLNLTIATPVLFLIFVLATIWFSTRPIKEAFVEGWRTDRHCWTPPLLILPLLIGAGWIGQMCLNAQKEEYSAMVAEYFPKYAMSAIAFGYIASIVQIIHLTESSSEWRLKGIRHRCVYEKSPTYVTLSPTPRNILKPNFLGSPRAMTRSDKAQSGN